MDVNKQIFSGEFQPITLQAQHASVSHGMNFMLWPSRRRISHAMCVVWAMDAIENGACPMNPVPTLTDLQLSPKLTRDVLEQSGYATFRAALALTIPALDATGGV